MPDTEPHALWPANHIAGAPRCGVLLQLQHGKSVYDMILTFRQCLKAINDSPYEKNSHIIAYAPQDNDPERAEKAETFGAIARSAGMVFMIVDDLDMAGGAHADGLISTNPDLDITAARKKLGPERLLAAPVKDERVDAVVWGQSDTPVDLKALIAARAELGNATLIVRGQLTADVNAAHIADCGADFLDLSSPVWDAGKKAAHTLTSLMISMHAFDTIPAANALN